MKDLGKFLLVIGVIVLVCYLGYIGKDYKDEILTGSNATSNKVISSNNEPNTNNTIKNNNTNKVENVANNKTENNTQNNTKNNTQNNETEIKDDENDKKDEENNNNDDKKEEVVQLTDDEKAKELAKKQYGTGDGVYFRIEQISGNGIYIVSVRDSETTKDLQWYTVDVKNETVK